MASSTRKTAALVRGFLTDVVAGDVAAEVFLDDDIETYQLVFGAGRGDDGLSNVADVVATADRVAVRGRVTGTHQESFMDLAPTGAAFEIAAVWLCRIEGGRIAEFWSLPDSLGLLRQLGAIPSRGENQSTLESTERYSP